jgi:hypothetical protein
MGKQPKSKPLPKCKALLLCDQLIVEQGTEKLTLVGVFRELAFPEFPADTDPFVVFVQLVDGIGRYNITVEVLDLEDDAVFARAEVDNLTFPPRPSRINLKLVLKSVSIPHAGKYDLLVLADGAEIDRQQFVVIPKGEPSGD